MGWQPKKTCEICLMFDHCGGKKDAEKCSLFSRVPSMPPVMKPLDAEARKEEHCLCASCKHSGICKYYSKFIEFQQAHFPAKIDCYKYEKEERSENNV